MYLFFFINIIIKNDIRALFIIGKQQPQQQTLRKAPSIPSKQQQQQTLARLLASLTSLLAAHYG